MLLIAFRSFFIIAVIFGYSAGIMRLINDYFRNEFKDYLHEEIKKNKHVLVDQNKEQPIENLLNAKSDDPSKPSKLPGSVTANRLLDELIVNFGRLFTTRNEAKNFRHPSGLKSKNSDPTQNDVKENLINAVPGSGGKSENRNSNGIQNSDLNAEVKSETKFNAKKKIEDDVPPGSSPPSRNAANDDDNAADEEEKWINYWKNRGVGKAASSSINSVDSGHCKAKPDNNEPVIDSCGHNLPPS